MSMLGFEGAEKAEIWLYHFGVSRTKTGKEDKGTRPRPNGIHDLKELFCYYIQVNGNYTHTYVRPMCVNASVRTCTSVSSVVQP